MDVQQYVRQYVVVVGSASGPAFGEGVGSYLTDITIELLEGGDNVEGCIKPTALGIFRRGSTESGQLLDLSQVSVHEWKVWGAAQLPLGVGELDCFLLEGDETIGFVLLDDLEHAEGMSVDQDFSRSFEILHPQKASLQYLISWRRVPTAMQADVQAIKALVERSSSSHDRFQNSHEFMDISDAIATLQTALDLAPESSGSLCAKLNDDLGQLLRERFNTFGDTQDLAQAISAQRMALRLTPVGGARLPGTLHNLGSSLLDLLKHGDEPKNLAEAISILSQAVKLIPEGDANLPSTLSLLGGFCLHRYLCTNALQDIAEVISLQSKAVGLTPEVDPRQPFVLANLGKSLRYRFKHTGALEDLAEAISLQSKAVRLMPEGDAELPILLDTLSASYAGRFECTRDLQDVDMAISLSSQAVQLMPEGHIRLSGTLNILSILLYHRFERKDDLRDISEAILAGSRAVELTPKGHTDLPGRLHNLGSLYLCRFERTGELHDMAQSISLRSQALQLTPEGDPDLPVILNGLGESYFRCFERMGELQDVERAISLHSQAVDLTPEGHPDLPRFLMALGASLSNRFERTGDLQDLSKAISLESRAVHLTPEGDEDLPCRLDYLGSSFVHRFERTGDLKDVTEAISLRSKAIQLTPVGHSGLPGRLVNHGASLMCRFKRTGDLQDIAEAIFVQSKAVHLIPESDTGRPTTLGSLGASFRLRFDQTGHLHDLSEAISLQSRVVQLTPEGHAELPTRLNSLATSLLHRSVYESQERPNNILIDGQTVEVILEGDTSQPDILNSLENVLLCPVEYEGGDRYIIEAISLQTRAVRLTPDGHAGLPSRLRTLGICWYQLFRLCGLPQHVRNSMSSHRWAATCNFGSPRDRLDTAARWARPLSYLHQTHAPELIIAWETAIRLLSQIAGLEETVQSRHTMMQEHANIPLRAASAAFLVNRPDKALEWLEQGRCLVWGQQAQLRTPLDELGAQNAPLANRVMGVSRRLENAGSSSRTRNLDTPISEKISLEHEAEKHLLLAREWEGLLKEVRSMPGFENFLQPSPIAALLQRLPASGHVVVINVNDDRCDAIALQAGADQPLHIPLPLFSLKKAQGYMHALINQLMCNHLRARGGDRTSSDENSDSDRAMRPYREGSAQHEGQVHMVLRCLWEELVKPILKGLDLLRVGDSSTDALPRIWWCPTGPLSFLPIHAAGNYRGVQGESAMDHVVSSYTPTVTALTKRVSTDHKIDLAVSGIFLTSQPKPNGEYPIPGTTKEVESVHKKASEHVLRSSKLEGDEVSPAECLEHMEKFSIVHLACHAVQNSSEPLKSCFAFHKGRLDLNTIMQKDLKNADLAFLSACQTGTGEDTLSDEAVHLAAGMLAAGYRRVVATMWGIKDEYAPGVADDFYDYLWASKSGDGEPQLDGSKSAHALHHAIQQLRGSMDNTDKSLLSWIPYVHFGY